MIVSRFLVYGLIDPRNSQLRYVGKSTSGLRRPFSHMKPYNLQKISHRVNWLRQLEVLGQTPEVIVVEEHETADALYEAEHFWIAYFRSVGCNLVNSTDGGKGTLGYRRTPEVKARTAARHRGMKRTLESKAIMSVAQRLSWQQKIIEQRSKSSETRIKMSRSRGGRPFCDETGRVYNTQREAATALGLSPPSVHWVLSGKQTQTKGHVFRYLQSHG